MGVLIYATPEGLALSDDSIAYIAGARSILDGQGYREAWLATNSPVTHFPPAFSYALAFIGLSGLDPLRGAHFLNIFLFGASAFLLGIIGWRMTKSQVAGCVLAALFAVNSSLFRTYAAAMSEPLYIFFSLVAFLTFAKHLSTTENTERTEGFEKKYSVTSVFSVVNIWLVATGVLTALAYLTRYAGLALLATFFLAMVLFGGVRRGINPRLNSWKSAKADLLAFFGGFLPLVLAWSIRNWIVADNATNRVFVFHPLTMENLSIGANTLAEFFIPVESWRNSLAQPPVGNADIFGAFLILLALSIVGWLAVRGLYTEEAPETLSFVNGLYIFAYLASMISSMLFFDASTKFKLRIVAPIYVSLFILLVLFGYFLWQKRALFLQVLVAAGAIFILTISIYDTAGHVAKYHRSGQGYASFQWYDSKAMAFLKKLPAGTRIYTNQAPAVYLYTRRPAYVLPDLVDPVTNLPRGNFELGVKNLHESILSGEGVLALFGFDKEAEEVKVVYRQLADGLYLAHDTKGDKIYTAYP